MSGLPRRAEESVPTGLSPVKDGRKLLFCWEESCSVTQLDRQTVKQFHEITCAYGGATSGAPQLRNAKKIFLVQKGSLLSSSIYPGAGFCH